jgi:hypothetical protein
MTLLSEIHSHKNKSMIFYIYFKSKIVIIVPQTKLLDFSNNVVDIHVTGSFTERIKYLVQFHFCFQFFLKIFFTLI